MNFGAPLLRGDIIGNKELSGRFQCGIRGGIRYSKKTNTLVIIVDHTKGLYADQWIDEQTIAYVGAGRKGHQELTRMNKVLAEAMERGTTIHLFEVFEKGRYFYQGQAELAGAPYDGWQKDEEGNWREVWIFPLKLIDGPRLQYLQKVEEEERQEARRLTDDELRRRAQQSQGTPPKIPTYSRDYRRNQYVAEYVKRRAHGKCELCGNDAPFEDPERQPYLEVHHIVWLSKGGKDTLDNTVALCPNCHRKMHILNLQEDVKKLKEVAREKNPLRAPR